MDGEKERKKPLASHCWNSGSAPSLLILSEFLTLSGTSMSSPLCYEEPGWWRLKHSHLGRHLVHLAQASDARVGTLSSPHLLKCQDVKGVECRSAVLRFHSYQLVSVSYQLPTDLNARLFKTATVRGAVGGLPGVRLWVAVLRRR